VSGGWPRFLLGRLIRVVAVCFILVTVVFVAVRLVPGDPAQKAVGFLDGTRKEKDAAIERARSDLNLDQSLPRQYVQSLVSAITFDYGVSFRTQESVSRVILDRLGSTLRLALGGTMVVIGIAVPLGLIVGLSTNGRRKGLEVGFSGLTGFVGSVPPYVMATLLIYAFVNSLPWFPRIPEGSVADDVLPSLAVGLGPALLLARIIRLETLSVLGQDYARTARSKWLPSGRVVVRDVLPNVLAPALTIGGVVFASLIGGAVVVEGIFNRNGLGSKLVESILIGDFPVVQAVALLLGVVVVVVNALVDVALAVVDPRRLVT